MKRLVCAVALCALSVVLASCHKQEANQTTIINLPTGPSPSPPTVKVVAISTPTLTITLTNSCFAKVDFTATVQGDNLKDTSVTYDQMANLAQTGTTTATLTVTVAGTYVVKAVANQDKSTSGVVTVIVNGPCGGGGNPNPTPTPTPPTPTPPTPNPPTPNPPAPLPPTCTLTADRLSIAVGQQARLDLVSTGATEAAKSWTSNIAPLSTDFVSPTQTTTYTATCKGPGGSTPATPVTITVTQPTPVIRVDVEPKAFTCSVGGQGNVGATVIGTADQRVTWRISDTSVISQKEINQNTIVMNCLKQGTVTVTAIAVVDPSKFDQATGTVIASGPACDWSTTTGLQADGTVIVSKGQNIAANGFCGGVLPAWYSSDPSRVGVKGTNQTTINGKIFETGINATISPIAVGQAEVCVQEALTQPSPARCRTVIVR